MAKKSKPTISNSSSPSSHPPSSPGSHAPPDVPPLSKLQGFEMVTIDRRQIKNAPYNPRTISPAQRRKLTASLKRFKLVEPLVWNARTGNLVGGHQRLSVIDGIEGTDEYSLTVARINVDDSTEKALNIALNNPEAQGQYDLDLLADTISSIYETSPTLIQDAGFDVSNLSLMFGDSFLTGNAAKQAESDAPLVEQLNDMYEAGAAAEKQRKSASGGSGKTAATSPDESSDESSDDSQPPESQTADDPNAPPDEATYGQKGWTKQDFKDRRREYSEQRSNLDESNMHLTIVFDSGEQLGEFLGQLGLNQNLVMIDAVTILPLLGIEFEEVPGDDVPVDDSPGGETSEDD